MNPATRSAIQPLRRAALDNALCISVLCISVLGISYP
jgi:hypothetical protein